MNGQIDVLEHGEEHLAEDLLPELEVEEVDSLLQYLEEDVQGLDLIFIGLVQAQISQVGQDWEPKTFLDAESNLLLRWLL